MKNTMWYSFVTWERYHNKVVEFGYFKEFGDSFDVLSRMGSGPRVESMHVYL